MGSSLGVPGGLGRSLFSQADSDASKVRSLLHVPCSALHKSELLHEVPHIQASPPGSAAARHCFHSKMPKTPLAMIDLQTHRIHTPQPQLTSENSSALPGPPGFLPNSCSTSGLPPSCCWQAAMWARTHSTLQLQQQQQQQQRRRRRRRQQQWQPQSLACTFLLLVPESR
jgi:hypothetical protein